MNSKNLSTSVLMFVWGAALGTLFGLNFNGQISLHVGPPTTPVVVNQTDNHYTAEVNVPSTVIVEDAGWASVTVNVPDEIKFREVVPSPPPTLTPEMDQLLDALLSENSNLEFRALHEYGHMSTHRIVHPDQILDPEELVIGTYVDLYNSNLGFVGTYMVAGPIYCEEVLPGERSPRIDMVDETGMIVPMFLEDKSVLPYPGGHWNNVNRLFKASAPAVPYQLPGDEVPSLDRPFDAN